MSLRIYHYVAPSALGTLRRGEGGLHVRGHEPLKDWIIQGGGRKNAPAERCATFIIDPLEQLWIADRRSEHVACANGGDVLAAGEITFEAAQRGVIATEITNQSTGYCPEPSCWDVVARMLDQLGIRRPDFFTAAFDFRRCDHCHFINLIKEQVFECAVCGKPLNRNWNFP
jgi:hypothetical protein